MRLKGMAELEGSCRWMDTTARPADLGEGGLDAFDDFARDAGARLRRGLVAAYGVEIGTEAAAEALRYAWEHWERVATMANPAGYLFRVGQSTVRPLVRWQRRRVQLPATELAAPAGASRDELLDLFTALRRLTPEQRVAVVLVRGHGHSYRDAAELLDVSVDALTNHVHRGMKRLRRLMEITDDHS